MLHTNQEKNSSDTCTDTFPFLRLPAELRETIYHHHLTSKNIVPRHRCDTTRWTPIDLLYVSRTIYNEAFYHLYTRGKFVLQVSPLSIFSLATCWGTEHSDVKASLELFVKSKQILDLIRYIILDIHWPSIEFSKIMDRDSGPFGIPIDILLKEAMAEVGAILSRLPGLRIIDISWINTTLWMSELDVAPPKHRIPGWLRGLKRVRRSNEKVLIRMPLKGSISTEELARNQEDRGEMGNLLREVIENVEEMQGCLRDRYFWNDAL